VRKFLNFVVLVGFFVPASVSFQKEDERATFIHGVVLQVYSKANSEPKLTIDELYKIYQDRIVPKKSDNDPLFKEREDKFKEFLARLAGFARVGLKSDELSTDFKVEDQLAGYATVAWKFKLPARIIASDNPAAREIQWTFMVTNLVSPFEPGSTKTISSWKILDIAKDIH